MLSLSLVSTHTHTLEQLFPLPVPPAGPCPAVALLPDAFDQVRTLSQLHALVDRDLDERIAKVTTFGVSFAEAFRGHLSWSHAKLHKTNRFLGAMDVKHGGLFSPLRPLLQSLAKMRIRSSAIATFDDDDLAMGMDNAAGPAAAAAAATGITPARVKSIDKDASWTIFFTTHLRDLSRRAYAFSLEQPVVVHMAGSRKALFAQRVIEKAGGQEEFDRRRADDVDEEKLCVLINLMPHWAIDAIWLHRCTSPLLQWLRDDLREFSTRVQDRFLSRAAIDQSNVMCHLEQMRDVNHHRIPPCIISRIAQMATSQPAMDTLRIRLPVMRTCKAIQSQLMDIATHDASPANIRAHLKRIYESISVPALKSDESIAESAAAAAAAEKKREANKRRRLVDMATAAAGGRQPIGLFDPIVPPSDDDDDEDEEEEEL